MALINFTHRSRNIAYFALLLLLISCNSNTYKKNKTGENKFRVVLMTDILNEVDDSQTLVRFLMYANKMDIEGIIAVSSCHQYKGKNDPNPVRNTVQPEEIKKFIANNLYENGMSLDFKIRDSLTYAVYTLTPLVETCINLWKSDRDVYYFYIHSSKSSIIKSIRWLIPYITGDKKNIMFINSIYASDRNKNEYGKIWDKKDALNLINLCINFDRTLIGLYNES